EIRPRVGVLVLPSLESLHGLAFRGRPSYLDQRRGGPAPPGRAGSFPRSGWRHGALGRGLGGLASSSGGLDPHGFPRLLGELWRPRRVAEPFGLVLGGQRQEPLQRSRRVVHSLPRIAD